MFISNPSRAQIAEINQRIEAVGIKKSAIANLIGVSVTTLSYYLNYKEPMPRKHRESVVKILAKLEGCLVECERDIVHGGSESKIVDCRVIRCEAPTVEHYDTAFTTPPKNSS